MISRVVTRNEEVHRLRFSMAASNEESASWSVKSTKKKKSFSVMLCLMSPGPAYNCKSVPKMPKSTPSLISRNLISPPPHLRPCFLRVAHLHRKSFPLLLPGISATLICPLIQPYILPSHCLSQRRVWASGT